MMLRDLLAIVLVVSLSVHAFCGVLLTCPNFVQSGQLLARFQPTL